MTEDSTRKKWSVRKAEIEMVADSVLANFDTYQPPIVVGDIASSYKITVSLGSDDEAPHFAGYIKFLDKGAEIIVNEDHPRKRQRFTVAHELGHYFLHKDQLGPEHQDTTSTVLFRTTVRETQEVHEREMEANHFAACLLMPADLVTQWYLAIGESDQSPFKLVSSMAELFDVSEQAMSIRLNTLRLRDGAEDD